MAKIVDVPELSETELAIVQEHFQCPVLIKYLRSHALHLMIDLAEAVPIAGQSDTEFVREQERWRGSLATFNTLLSINKE